MDNEHFWENLFLDKEEILLKKFEKEKLEKMNVKARALEEKILAKERKKELLLMILYSVSFLVVFDGILVGYMLFSIHS